MDLLLEHLPSLATSGAHIDLVPPKPSDNFYTYILLFSLQSEDEYSRSTTPIVSSFNLGRPGGSITSALRLTRDKCYWLFAHQDGLLPSHTDTQILALRSSKHVVALLPLTTDACMGTLRGPLFEPEKDLIFARFERSHSATETGQAVVTIAKDINSAIKASVVQARLLLNVPGPLVNTPTLNSYIFESKLTYCTWNSLQPPTPTTGASALKALEHFHSIGIRPAAFLIDDAWQDVKSFRLQSFDSKRLFLDKIGSLGELVKTAKDKYGVAHVGVWHTIQGYWQGVEPSKFASQYSLVKVTKDGYPGPAEEEGFEYYIPHPDSVQNFFNDYYATLRTAGITFTKCDNMASMDHIVSAIEVTYSKSGEEIFGSSVDIVMLRKAYVQAVTSAALEAFGAANVICINALLLNELDVQPDLDMFQTHPYISSDGGVHNTNTGISQGSFHASFRVFGTGPVTITDAPGKSNPEILTKMVGDTAPGPSPSIVVQASTAFTVLNDVFDPRIMCAGVGRGLKVYVDKTVGIWNVQSGEGRLVEFITASDIAQALGVPSNSVSAVVLYIQSSNPANERVVLHDTSNTLHPAAPIRIELDPLGWATVGVVEISSLGNQSKVACPGLVDKYLASQGITETRVSGKGSDWSYTVVSKCSGTLGLWTTPEVSVKSVEVNFVGENGDLGSAQNPEIETTDVGKAKWVTLKLKGRSKVVFDLTE
ncbi:Raffinose synthase or seed imbibition protein Sip1, partial [Rhizoctonia solani]